MLPFIVLLDACVLVPVWLRDVLLWAATQQLYRPCWSNQILDEMERALVRKLGLSEEKASAARAAMIAPFPDASVDGYETLVTKMTNHPKDRHVLAAAVRARARIIVTANRTDFPHFALDEYDIEALTPDEFLLRLLDDDEEAMFEALELMAGAKHKPALTVRQMLPYIGATAPNFAAEIDERLERRRL